MIYDCLNDTYRCDNAIADRGDTATPQRPAKASNQGKLLHQERRAARTKIP